MMWKRIRDSEIGLKWSVVALIAMLLISISLSVSGCHVDLEKHVGKADVGDQKQIKFYDFGGR